jgi:hypothetical protein
MGMEAVLGIREDRTYKTPDLQRAQVKAKEYRLESFKRAPVGLDPETDAILNEQTPSIRSIFSCSVIMAFTGESDYSVSNPDGSRTTVIVPEGGRRWGQRALAICAGVSVNTARKALARLEELNLLVVRRIQGVGTHVTVAGFKKFTRSKFWRAVLERKPRSEKTKRVSKIDTFLPRSASQRSLSSTVDVQSTSPGDQKEGDTSEKVRIRAIIARGKAKLGIT